MYQDRMGHLMHHIMKPPKAGKIAIPDSPRCWTHTQKLHFFWCEATMLIGLLFVIQHVNTLATYGHPYSLQRAS